VRAIVLAAGRGRRLEPLTLSRPKPLIWVAGRPILAHVLDPITAIGMDDIVVVAGHLGTQIADYLERRPAPKPKVVVQSPLGGNGDAVRAAREYLDGPLLVAFGDTIVRGDLAPACRGDTASIAVAWVEDGRSYGIVEMDRDGWVRRLWEKPANPPSHDAAAGTFFFPDGRRLRRALDEIAASGVTGRDGEVWLTDVVQHMIDHGERVRTFRIEAFYDCGTPERLAEADRALRTTPAARPGRAVFVDRDGVLIRDVNHLTAASQIEVLDGVPQSLRRLRDAGWAVVVATNQSVVARGWITEDGLREIHRALTAQLGAGGAVLDAIYYCPHHPDGAMAAYRTMCDCRKPRPGMLVRAAADLNLDLRASVMVGDASSDIEAGRQAGCRTVLIRDGGGTAARSGNNSAAVADYVASDFAHAVDWILSSGGAPAGV